MFIYFCQHVMDEMIELFSTINQMEKGAIGLFFEMNHIIGLSLTIYIGWFIYFLVDQDLLYNNELL